MRARVKADSKLDFIFAFSGREFSKSDWREVPAGFEEEAAGNPYLELDAPAAKAAVVEMVMPAEPKPETVDLTEDPEESKKGESSKRPARREK